MPVLASPKPSQTIFVPDPTRKIEHFNGTKTPSPSTSRTKASRKTQPVDETSLDNPDLGPFLLKLARDTFGSGESPNKALDYAIRASKSFERFEEAVRVLERAIEVSDPENGPDHALAKFSGYMQLGDTCSMLGQLEQSILCYESGLKIQRETLGGSDPRVAETCRYLAEAHVQVMQFDEAENYCKKTLEIRKEHSSPASVEEAADRRLMALIYEAKGDYESALEHLVLASMIMIANGQDNEVAAIDMGIGDIYLSLCRFDEAVFSYQKALTVFKSTRGENHPSVASVFIRLANLYYKTGKLRESKSYCENALRIYAKPLPGIISEEIASGLTEISAIYEAVNEPEEALNLLQKAMKLLEDTPAQRSTIAGIEAQMGVMFYMVGRYGEAWRSFQSAISKLRASGERKSAHFGIVLNQMGLASVQLYKLDEAARFLKKQGRFWSRSVAFVMWILLEYIATLQQLMMPWEEAAIEMLEHILKVREEKLGTAHPDFDDEKKRLADLLKEAGRARNRKGKSLENLLGSNSHQRTKKEGVKRWAGFGNKT
ncbi:protein KINESIN LIGHT CHAIN-RELATED 1 [Prunus yedoensis var. nudiflora]|uniref:Protein KINESIN LIGHT CHAIN-RELATED 1 n=1 Tax=Prunus yedoensis var. nudiflora TaxID=2094558 RepID=A0A315AP80_PRUYE|nr:protein KINESIN LIGHT CHAIN-RELATED 1 [Prunus yedoensis var. nudiflora]